jgi:subtilisin family serine protease
MSLPSGRAIASAFLAAGSIVGAAGCCARSTGPHTFHSVVAAPPSGAPGALVDPVSASPDALREGLRMAREALAEPCPQCALEPLGPGSATIVIKTPAAAAGLQDAPPPARLVEQLEKRGFRAQVIDTVDYEAPPEEPDDCQRGKHLDAACADPEWSLKQIRYDEALALLAKRPGRPPLDVALPGAGIVVGHPDTGYTRHPELFDAAPDHTPLRPLVGWNFKDRDPDPSDLLKKPALPFTRQPGHGTQTGSVIASRRGPQGESTDKAFVSGIAPGVELVPLRSVDGVILGEGRSVDVAMAIRHASLPERAGTPTPEGEALHYRRFSGRDGSYVGRQVHVISLSLGGACPGYETHRLAADELRAAIVYAERQGVIIVAAAGQLLPGVLFWGKKPVTYPGAFDAPLAIAASDAYGRPWKDSCRGREVDITAPGESVWRANAEGPLEHPVYKVGMGRGTSFATATVAGVAALWLDRYGRDRIVERYGAPAVNSAFKYVVKTRGFRTPKELCADSKGSRFEKPICASRTWDTAQFGPGILDASRVLAADELPTRQDVCAWVKDVEKRPDWHEVCP